MVAVFTSAVPRTETEAPAAVRAGVHLPWSRRDGATPDRSRRHPRGRRASGPGRGRAPGERSHLGSGESKQRPAAWPLGGPSGPVAPDVGPGTGTKPSRLPGAGPCAPAGPPRGGRPGASVPSPGAPFPACSPAPPSPTPGRPRVQPPVHRRSSGALCRQSRECAGALRGPASPRSHGPARGPSCGLCGGVGYRAQAAPSCCAQGDRARGRPRRPKQAQCPSRAAVPNPSSAGPSVSSPHGTCRGVASPGGPSKKPLTNV